MNVFPHNPIPDPPPEPTGRSLSSLSLFLARTCSFRCLYCSLHKRRMLGESRVLRLDEISRLVDAFADMGVTEVALSGGEPTLRPDFVEIVRKVSSQPRIVTTELTTNGHNLTRNAIRWREAGVNTLTVAIDSLKRDRFQKITGQDKLPDILAGLEAALCAGYKSVKVEMVLLKDINEDEVGDYLDLAARWPVDIRIVELMRTGHNDAFFQGHHMPADPILSHLKQSGWSRLPPLPNGGVAQIYSHPAYVGTFGLIASYPHKSCKTCNGLWVTPSGEMRFCLFGDTSISLRHLLQEDDQRPLLMQLISSQVYLKPVSPVPGNWDGSYEPSLVFSSG